MDWKDKLSFTYSTNPDFKPDRDEENEKLGKTLKTQCGVGGTVKNGEIIIQGEIKQKVASILQAMGYKVTISG